MTANPNPTPQERLDAMSREELNRWFREPGDLEVWEDIASWFNKETGHLRPGKDKPAEFDPTSEGEPDCCLVAWIAWRHKQEVRAIRGLRSALDAAEAPCVWIKVGESAHESSCRLVTPIPVPKFCPGCGHPVKVDQSRAQKAEAERDSALKACDEAAEKLRVAEQEAHGLAKDFIQEQRVTFELSEKLRAREAEVLALRGHIETIQKNAECQLTALDAAMDALNAPIDSPLYKNARWVRSEAIAALSSATANQIVARIRREAVEKVIKAVCTQGHNFEVFHPEHGAPYFRESSLREGLVAILGEEERG